MRFQTVGAGETWAAVGRFLTGFSVTISLYNAETGASIPLDSNACAEIGSTGIFRFNSSQITTDPTTRTHVVWQMTNGSVTAEGEVVVGGYVDDVDAATSSRAVAGDEMNLVDGAITAAKIAAAAITSAKFAAGAITSTVLAANAITSTVIANGAIAAGKIGSGAIQASTYAVNAITSAAISSGAFTSAKFADGFLTALKIGADAITAAKIATDAGAEIADAVWDEARAGHTTPGTYGENTGDAPMRGTDGANTVVPLAAAVDQAEHDATQADVAALVIPTAAANADAVWDEARAGHTTPGSYGENTGDAPMRGTDGANTVVPLAAAADTAAHAQTQADIAALALASVTAADVTAAVWGLTEVQLAAAGETGELLLFGNTLRSDIDLTGDDSMGWQLVVYDRSGTEIARANLFDEAYVRVPETTTVAQFISGQKTIGRIVPV